MRRQQIEGFGARGSSALLPPQASAETAGRVSAPRPVPARVHARGKFLWAGTEKLFVKGVTYGPFAPGEDPQGFAREQAAADFAAMAAAGVNTVRIYDAPPPWLLDLAARHGLYVIAGLAWEQHVAFLEDAGRARAIVRAARTAVAGCAGHPALLAWCIGNEIPSEVVRWHGRRRVERFLRRLAGAVRAADPDALVTYAGYPSTEYLALPFLDFLAFNLFLEDPERLAAYLARLHNLAGERPLVLTELGLDAARNGEQAQASALRDQLGVAFAGGCAGAVVFSWTDAWHRGGAEVEDWAFGLTRRDRTPKPALRAVARALRAAPFGAQASWPRVSVIVCSRDGAATIGDCLEGVTSLDYPDYEAIVVDDGSSDATAEIAARFPGVRLIRTPNRGLSAARNSGLEAASGELVAYLDDDARPDRHWLRYLATSFRRTRHAGIGGPNIQPGVEGLMARAIAGGPGGPIHVLLSDTVAEHIPGCNMTFRRAALEEIGGFDPRFRVAGDDVDVCWRLQERGWTLGFSPAAVVDHRARTTLRGYWRQQRGYGRAEALLERKWPERYNGGGHLTWAGRVYGNAAAGHRHRRWRVYYGAQNSGLFQHADDRAPGLLALLPLMPEWYLLLALLAAVAALGLAWAPLALASLPLAIALAATGARAALDAWQVVASRPGTTLRGARRRWALTALMHVVQPPARLVGRLGYGLAPWRGRAAGRLALPLARTCTTWHEHWRPPAARRAALEQALRDGGQVVRGGGPYDRWDLEVRAGALGRARVRLAVEEHGQGRQLVRARVWPHVSLVGLLIACACAAAATVAAGDAAWLAAAVLAAAGLAFALWTLRDAAAALGALLGELAPPRVRASVPREHVVAELHPLPAGEEL
jgi:GT2 family glycosyltransferase